MAVSIPYLFSVLRSKIFSADHSATFCTCELYLRCHVIHFHTDTTSVPSINIDEILVGVRVKFFVWAVTVYSMTSKFYDRAWYPFEKGHIKVAGWIVNWEHSVCKAIPQIFMCSMVTEKRKRIMSTQTYRQRNLCIESFECQTRLPWPMASESKWFIFRCSTVLLWCIFTSRRCDELSIGKKNSNNYGPSCPQIFDHRFFTSVLESSNASQHAIVSVAK